MDYKATKEIKKQVINLTSRLTILEEMTNETIEKINKVQNTCNHELILIYNKYTNKAYEYLQYGKCLVCGKSIILTPDNVNTETNLKVDTDNIIDIKENVEEWSFDYDCAENKKELEVAQKVFDNLFCEDFCLRYKERVKYEILNALKNLKLTKKNNK